MMKRVTLISVCTTLVAPLIAIAQPLATPAPATAQASTPAAAPGAAAKSAASAPASASAAAGTPAAPPPTAATPPAALPPPRIDPGPAPAESQPAAASMPVETTEQRDARMAWWRQARFGMFIHWGLYAVPAGEWNRKTSYGEWIRDSAHIPIDEYDKFKGRFNPVKFDAKAWARMAREAGMKYIVITSKHHDGFALFDSKESEWDVMATPFRRDVLRELADACKAEGVQLCFYHSIMDWHHPDYLPRRGWETRSGEGADFDRYVAYMKRQLTELLTNYGPIGVLWFDGEWESTWSHEYGVDVAAHVRRLQPAIIINNRVDIYRDGMAGMSVGGRSAGDFGTPEQEIPAAGLSGVDWETCMTMNDNWGYNRADKNFKSTQTLIRNLVDVASKGGNFLLNVGPTAEGEFPQESIQRLAEIGKWMKVNGASIYGTQASPFSKPQTWGRVTRAAVDPRPGVARLYLHVFDWPKDGVLKVANLMNAPAGAALLADESKALQAESDGNAVRIKLAGAAPDAIDSVIRLDVQGEPETTYAPDIAVYSEIFVDFTDVNILSDRRNVEWRYTLDGSDPRPDSTLFDRPIRLTETTTVSASGFRDGKPVSDLARAVIRSVTPGRAVKTDHPKQGLRYEYYEGEYDKLPDFSLLTPRRVGTIPSLRMPPGAREDGFAVRFSGLIHLNASDVYTFGVISDDGSRLEIDGARVVDNDGPHGAKEATGQVALSAGMHRFVLTYFERTGDEHLEWWIGQASDPKRPIRITTIFHDEGEKVEN